MDTSHPGLQQHLHQLSPSKPCQSKLLPLCACQSCLICVLPFTCFSPAAYYVGMAPRMDDDLDDLSFLTGIIAGILLSLAVLLLSPLPSLPSPVRCRYALRSTQHALFSSCDPHPPSTDV